MYVYIIGANLNSLLGGVGCLKGCFMYCLTQSIKG
jgi:hypothetical protein